MRPRVGVMWFRRDLRVADHPAFAAALADCDAVVPLFVWDPHLVGPAGAPRLAFLAGCLRELDQALGGNLVVRPGDPATVVPAVAAEVGAGDVWCTEDFGPYGRARDQAVQAALAGRGRQLRAVGSPYVVAPGSLVAGSGRPYRVFTPFLRAWLAEDQGRPGAANVVSAAPTVTVGGEPLPATATATTTVTTARLPEPGERAAHRALDRFLGRRGGRGNGVAAADRYGDDRDRADRDGSSRLSPYLRFGCLHPRQLLGRLDPGRPGHRKLEAEVAWREFYADVLFHHPGSARASYRNGWLDDAVDRVGSGRADVQARWEAWTKGTTGYPMVDAGMRQLATEAWMPNRVRMVAASFLVKDLHIDWRDGARWFMRRLVDGDLAQNQHNWQWVAGTGTDPAPYFRIFNPVAQARRFDPDGVYVRRWVPELAGVSAESVHEPSAPIVDHAAERAESLRRYRGLRPPA